MGSVVVVGSINRDIVVRVAHQPTPGETVLGRDATFHPGGKGSNQAVAARRLAAPDHGVRMIGRIGCDGFGSEMRVFLEREGIDTRGLGESASATGLAMITVDDRGENMITVASGANLAWPEGCPELALGPRDIVVCQLEVPLAIVEAAFEQARAARATTILNPAPCQLLPPSLLAATDLLILNEIELAQLLERPVADLTDTFLVPAVRTLVQAGPRAAIVTLGAAGALVVEASGRALRIPGVVARAFDTTGAGDCFVGALAAHLLDSDDLAAAATFANKAAAVSVTRPGAASSMPRRGELVQPHQARVL